MELNNMPTEIKLDWNALVDQYLEENRKTGISASAFALKNNLTKSTFSKYKKLILDERKSQNPQSNLFNEVKQTPTIVPAPQPFIENNIKNDENNIKNDENNIKNDENITISLSNGVSINIKSDFNEETLKRLVRCLND